MNKVYLISVTTALAAGWVAGFTAEGLVAKAARPTAQEVTYQLQVTPGQQATIESWIQSRFCAQINEEFELSGPQGCSGSKTFSRLTLNWITDEEGVRRLHAETRAMVRGEWVPQSAD